MTALHPLLLPLTLVLLSACGSPAEKAAPPPVDTPHVAAPRRIPTPEELPEGHNVVRASDGRPLMEGNIVHGKRDGQWTSFTGTGGPKSRNLYVNGVLEGPTIVYYDNGAVRYTGQHHNDKSVGEWKFYDEAGELTQTIVYDSLGVKVPGTQGR